MINPLTQATISFGCSWPNNEEDAWLNRMVEIRARQLTKPADRELSSWLMDTAVGLDKLLSKVQLPHTWTKFTLRQDVVDMFHTSTFPPENYKRIQEEGYYGAILPPSGWAQPFTEWEELITLFARSVIGTETKLGRAIV
jgi:hypothetical protein